MTNQNTQYVWLIIFLGILLMMAYCYQKCHHFEDISPIQSPLIKPFKSYMSIEEARQMLPSHQRNWQVFEDYSFSMIERYPPFHLYSVTVEDYKHLNHTGQLGLTFYNKRLAITSFSPIQAKSYLDTIEKKENLQVANHVFSDSTSFDKINLKPYTHVWLVSFSFSDYVESTTEKEYYHNNSSKYQSTIEWIDIRLLKEKERWEDCYSDD